MSCTFIVPVSLSDMFAGAELGLRISKFFGAMGLGLVVAPGLGSWIMQRAGTPLAVHVFRLAVSALWLFDVRTFVPETLTEERKRPFRWALGNSTKPARAASVEL